MEQKVENMKRNWPIWTENEKYEEKLKKWRVSTKEKEIKELKDRERKQNLAKKELQTITCWLINFIHLSCLKTFSSFEEKQFQHFHKDLIGPLLAFYRSGYTGKFSITFEIKCKGVLKRIFW